jgi:hypothetical protein
MGFLDRLLGREEPQPDPRSGGGFGGTHSPQRSEDEIAVERYRYLLRTAPPETIEQVHTEAFAKLTPEQRDLLFQQLSADATQSERPRDNTPASLAQAATRQELRNPGSMERTLGATGQRGGGMGFGGTFASSLLGTVTGFVIGSAIASAFMPDAADMSSADASADGGDADGGAGGGDFGGSGGDSGGDFGGGDFGGGDFGGGDFGGGDFGGF